MPFLVILASHFRARVDTPKKKSQLRSFLNQRSTRPSYRWDLRIIRTYELDSSNAAPQVEGKVCLPGAPAGPRRDQENAPRAKFVAFNFLNVTTKPHFFLARVCAHARAQAAAIGVNVTRGFLTEEKSGQNRNCSLRNFQFLIHIPQYTTTAPPPVRAVLFELDPTGSQAKSIGGAFQKPKYTKDGIFVLEEKKEELSVASTEVW